MPSQPIRRDAVLYVRLYMHCRHINSQIVSNKPRIHLFYFTASNMFNRITVS